MSTSYPDLSLTVFPESVDTFVTMMDVVASDATSLKAYQTAMEAGNLVQANAALEAMSSGVNKILTADKINKIFDSTAALQRFLATDIVPYVTQLQANWNTQVSAYSYKGTYSAATTYQVGNMVSYTVSGNTFIYICTATSTGNLPTNTSYWRQLTVVGMQGVSGTGLAFRYAWDAATSYSVQDCVTHNNRVWGCLVANTNSEPTTTNTNWQELMYLVSSIYPVQATQPTGQATGELWFQTIGSDF